MHVAHVVEATGGGVGRHLIDLAKGQADRGVSVSIIYSPWRATSSFLQELRALEREQDIRAIPIAMRPSIGFHDVISQLKLARMLRSLSPLDVVHAHSSKAGALARIAAPFTQVPTIYTPHGIVTMSPHVGKAASRFYGLAERALAKLGAAVIAVSPHEGKEIARVVGERTRIELIPNGIHSLAAEEKRTKQAARRELGLCEGHKVLGFVGRLEEPKDPITIVRAFASVAREVPEARLVVVGSGPLLGSAQAEAKRAGVENHVVWAGEVHGRAIMAAFDIFVLASKAEAFGYVILEAMDAGVPVISTANSGGQFLVEHLVSGLLTPPEDDRKLAVEALRLLKDPRLASRLTKNALRTVEQYDIDSMTDKTLALYEQIMK